MKKLLANLMHKTLPLVVVAAIVLSVVPVTAAADVLPEADIEAVAVDAEQPDDNGGLLLVGGGDESCVCTDFCDDPDCPVCKDDPTQCFFYYCVCEALCSEGSINADCPVCNDDYTGCVLAVEPPEIAPMAADATVGNQNDLQTEITNATDNTLKTIEITANFNITSKIILPAKKIITIKSDSTIRTLTRDSVYDDTLIDVGGASATGASLTLEDIIIDGGSGSGISDGGALVQIFGGNTFNMNSGAVLQNNHVTTTGGCSGGVNVGGTFNMNGGEIKNNYSGYVSGGPAGVSGGVNITSGGSTFTMTGGTISGNKTNSPNYGGGLSVMGTVTLGGNAKIFNNTNNDGATTCNVLCGNNREITLSSPVGGMNVGVTKDPTANDGDFVWSGAIPGDENYFFADDPTKHVELVGVALRIVSGPPPSPPTVGGGSGSPSGGSSSKGGGGSRPTQSTPQVAPLNDKPSGTLNAALGKAMGEHAKAEPGTQNSGVFGVKLKDVSDVTLKNVATIIKKAKELGAKAKLSSDTMSENGEEVEVRVTVDPEQVKETVRLDGYVRKSETRAVGKTFEKYFGNKTAVIRLGQQGAFGQTAKVAAKLNFTGFDTENLYIYRYDKQSGKYSLIKTSYRIDAKSYLHFYTAHGDFIIVSNGPLTKRGNIQQKSDGTLHYIAPVNLAMLTLDNAGGNVLMAEYNAVADAGAEMPVIGEAITPVLSKSSPITSGVEAAMTASPAMNNISGEPESGGKINAGIIAGVAVVLMFTAMMLWAAFPRKNDPMVSVEEYRKKH